MRFRYLGDKDDMTAFGYDFRDGTTPDVTDAHAIAKLSGNNHFEAVEEEETGATDAPVKRKGGRPRKDAAQP